MTILRDLLAWTLADKSPFITGVEDGIVPTRAVAHHRLEQQFRRLWRRLGPRVFSAGASGCGRVITRAEEYATFKSSPPR
jgi:hypothetical protein